MTTRRTNAAQRDREPGPTIELSPLTPPERDAALRSLLRGADGYSSADAPPMTRDDMHDRELDRLDLDHRR